MAFATASLNTMLDAIPAAGTLHVSLHTADPGSTGANESTGGSPAYARQAAPFDAAAAGSRALTADETFDVPASTITHFGIWDAATVGNFIGSGDITDEVFASQGQYKLLAASTSMDLS